MVEEIRSRTFTHLDLLPRLIINPRGRKPSHNSNNIKYKIKMKRKMQFISIPVEITETMYEGEPHTSIKAQTAEAFGVCESYNRAMVVQTPYNHGTGYALGVQQIFRGSKDCWLLFGKTEEYTKEIEEIKRTMSIKAMLLDDVVDYENYYLNTDK